MVRASAARAAEPVLEPAPVPEPVRALAYEDNSKSAVGAVGLEILFPGLGSVYAEDARGALITLGLVAGGLAAVIVGFSQLPALFPHGVEPPPMPPKASPVALPLMIGGAALAIYGRIFGLQNAANAADRYNTVLRTSLGLAPLVTSDAGGIMLGGRF